LAALFEKLVIFSELLLIDINSYTNTAWYPPIRSIGYWNCFLDDIVSHDVSGLLVPVYDIRQGEQYVMARGGSNPQFSVCMSTDLQAFSVRQPGRSLKLRQRPCEIGAEAVNIGASGCYLTMRVRSGPETLVR